MLFEYMVISSYFAGDNKGIPTDFKINENPVLEPRKVSLKIRPAFKNFSLPKRVPTQLTYGNFTVFVVFYFNEGCLLNFRL